MPTQKRTTTFGVQMLVKNTVLWVKKPLFLSERLRKVPFVERNEEKIASFYWQNDVNSIYACQASTHGAKNNQNRRQMKIRRVTKSRDTLQRRLHYGIVSWKQNVH